MSIMKGREALARRLIGGACEDTAYNTQDAGPPKMNTIGEYHAEQDTSADMDSTRTYLDPRIFDIIRCSFQHGSCKLAASMLESGKVHDKKIINAKKGGCAVTILFFFFSLPRLWGLDWVLTLEAFLLFAFLLTATSPPSRLRLQACA